MALVAAAAFSAPATAGSRPNSSTGLSAAAAKAAPAGVNSCYSQTATPVGNVTSQNFEASFDQYDNQAADDFKLTAPCAVSTVTVNGQYSASGPVDSFNVTFYKWKKSKVSKVTCNAPNSKYTSSDGVNFKIKLKKKCKLKAGMGWVSVQANMDFSTGGQWYWTTIQPTQYDPSMWQNPGDGFATGCTKWADLEGCLQLGFGEVDQYFILN